MGEIASYAVIHITEKSYPKTYAEWGQAGIARINSLMQPAAELVAASQGCDRLELLELSGQRSTAPNNIVFFADCANGNRFYITEAEILAGRMVVSQNDKSKWLQEQQLLEICQEAIIARRGAPCTFVGEHVYRAVAGRTVITVRFKEVGGGHAELAKCYFDGLSLTEIEMG